MDTHNIALKLLVLGFFFAQKFGGGLINDYCNEG